ncbi:cyanophycinase [Roseibacillus persicicus]|uniref:cyanophycinase n=1 Tax=Roseibacillus persicicus TaxID=454148 RepID=UPI00398ABE87
MTALSQTFSKEQTPARIHGLIRLAFLGAILLGFAGLLQGETTGPENGVLLIHGGGNVNYQEFVALAKKASGNEQPVIRVITTPQGERRKADFQKGIPYRTVSGLKKIFRLKEVTELYTLSKEEANTPAFYQQLDNADAVYITGGNQCFLTDAFLGTETLAALQRLLDRGGVIAGASAGAQVQSSFMTRGDYTSRQILGDQKHQEGFAFVKNAAFDVHVEERAREEDLLELFRAKKSQLQDKNLDPLELLGIGIDQGTAITVTRNQFRVTGKGQVYLFDPQQWNDDEDSWTYQILQPGTTYDLKLRKVIEE